MRQSTINIGAVVLMALTLPFTTLAAWQLRASMIESNDAAELERVVHGLGDDMKEASDYLTDQVRSFVATRQRTSLNLYWKEVETVRRRDLAIERLTALEENPMAAGFLREAKSESDALIGIEALAMRLTCEAIGWTEGEMPLKVAETTLPPELRRLDADAKLARARDLVFGVDYLSAKASIMAKIKEFNGIARDDADGVLRDARTRADRIFLSLVAIVLAGIAGGTAIVSMYYLQVSKPVKEYTDILSSVGAHPGGQGPAEGAIPILPPRGSAEIIALAEAYNLRRSEELAYETALRDSERRIKTHLRMMPLGAIEIDSKNRILSWNPAAEQIFGFTEEEAKGRDVIDLIVPEDLREEIDGVITRLYGGEIIRTNTNRNLRKDGREIICEWHNTPLFDSRDTWIGWASIVKDVTRQHEEEERILWLSHHDPLTGLLNRRRLLEKFEEERLRSARTGGVWATIMFDLDHFKAFNDSWGHECGDLVLVAVARAMAESVRATDSVGRWGGEEFLVLLPETGTSGAFELAEKVRKRVETLGLEYRGARLDVTITAGVASCVQAGRPEEGPSPVDDCIRRADGALLEAKAEGRNRTRAAG